MKRQFFRRETLRSMGTASLAFMILPEGPARTYAANQKLNIALVGCGGRGSWFVQAIPQVGENIVALRDMNEERAADSFGKLPDVPKFHDYRKRLQERDKVIDAVIIAAPDHIREPIAQKSA